MDKQLNTKIFLTDGEFEQLFGNKIAHIVGVLNQSSTDKDICSSCNGICCRDIGCLFYSPKFSGCPIFRYRPRECRYHFCNDVFKQTDLAKDEVESIMKPVQELVTADKGETAKLFFLFPEFPLDEKGLELIGLKEKVRDIIADFEAGKINDQDAYDLLEKIVISANI